MRKTYLQVLFIISFLCFVNSCTEDFTPAFKENTTERFLSARSKYDTILKSSKNGWLLQYFPGKDLKYGGFNYYIKFLEGNKMEVRTELYKSAKEAKESSYAIKQYGGAILSFDLYNSLMHYFATPSADEYKGKGGDFEFQIISYKDDVMTLQGIKTGNYMKLIRLKETPEEYNDKVNSIDAFIKAGFLTGEIASEQVNIEKSGLPFIIEYKGEGPVKENGRTLVFQYTEKGVQKKESVAFIQTDKGIEFYSPVSIEGKEYKKFLLSKDKKKSYF